MRHAARQLPSWLIFDVRQKKMIGVAILIVLAGCVAMTVAAVCVVLSFRGYRPAWHLALGVLPSFLIGSFYAVSLEVAQRGTVITKAVFWANAAMGIVCLTQLATRKNNEPNKAPEPTPGAVTPRATEGESK